MKRSSFLRLMLGGAGALGAATRDIHAEIPKMPTPVNPPAPARDRSVQLEIEHAIDKGLLALQTKQSSYGYWSTPETPGLTALVLTAFMEEPTGGLKAQPPDFVKKGYDYILKTQQPDGGIYLKGLANYSTSVCMLALQAADPAANVDILRRARMFLIGLQGSYPASTENAEFDGGIGYDAQDKPIQNPNSPAATATNANAPKPASAPVAAHLHYDLSNTAFAMEALRKTQQLAADQKIEGAKDLNWKAAAGFLERCQSLPGVNKQAWVKDDPKNNGGFVYEPKNTKGTPCYGSMTYAGLMSYIYADLKKDDPRVAAALGWLKGNYTLEQNPGMGADGLFYYYQMMSKALAAYGDVHLELTSGKKVDWASELALKLINLQGSDGTWVNTSGRWWEKDPTLVTAYAVLTLETLHARV